MMLAGKEGALVALTFGMDGPRSEAVLDGHGAGLKLQKSYHRFGGVTRRTLKKISKRRPWQN